jgi:hypothetical protein
MTLIFVACGVSWWSPNPTRRARVTRSTALRVRADACARRRARTPPFPFGGSIVTRVDRKDAGEIIRIVSVKLYFETKDPKRVRGKSTLTGLAERSRASTDRGVGRCRKRDPDEAHLPARANARGSRPRARTRGHAGRESSPSSPRSSPRRPRRRVHALPRAPRPRALARSVSARPASLTPGAELPGERTRAEGTPSRAHHARDSTPDRRARGSRRPPAPTVQPRGPRRDRSRKEKPPHSAPTARSTLYLFHRGEAVGSSARCSFLPDRLSSLAS